jgi:preprotein translocase subunit SecE
VYLCSSWETEPKDVRVADSEETDSVESAPSASPVSPDGDLSEDLPGEMLGDELIDPGEYEVLPEETEAEELDPLDPDQVDERIAPLDFEVDDEEQLVEAEDAAAKASSSRPVRRKRPVRTSTVADEVAGSPESAESPEEPASARPKRKTAAAGAGAPVKKDAPTAKQKQGKKKAKRRTGPVQFTRESVGELKKVVWPTMSQLRQYFVVVLIFVLFVIAYVGLLDLGFAAGLLWLFGQA